jgi:hypothetical protein
VATVKNMHSNNVNLNDRGDTAHFYESGSDVVVGVSDEKSFIIEKRKYNAPTVDFETWSEEKLSIIKSLINKKIEEYVKFYILCPICKRPDTKICDEAGVKIMICEACGAKNPVR